MCIKKLNSIDSDDMINSRTSQRTIISTIYCMHIHVSRPLSVWTKSALACLSPMTVYLLYLKVHMNKGVIVLHITCFDCCIKMAQPIFQ